MPERPDSTLADTIRKWREFADTDHTQGMKLSDAKKQGQHELLMAGQSLAYATAAKELEPFLTELRGMAEGWEHAPMGFTDDDGCFHRYTVAKHRSMCHRCQLRAALGSMEEGSHG